MAGQFVHHEAQRFHRVVARADSAANSRDVNTLVRFAHGLIVAECRPAIRSIGNAPLLSARRRTFHPAAIRTTAARSAARPARTTPPLRPISRTRPQAPPSTLLRAPLSQCRQAGPPEYPA